MKRSGLSPRRTQRARRRREQPITFFARALAQAPLPGLPGGADDRVLVVVNLQGGNDGLNTRRAARHAGSTTATARRSAIRAAATCCASTPRSGFNPAMRSLKAMYDAGRSRSCKASAIRSPDHSHFRSTEIWQTAAPDRYERTGWLGRYLDAAGSAGRRICSTRVAVAQVLPEVMISRNTDVPAIAQLGGYGLASDRQRRHARRLPSTGARRPRCRSARRTSRTSRRSKTTRSAAREELPKLVAGYKPEAHVSGDAARAQPRARGADRRQQPGHARALRAARLVRYARRAQKRTQDRLLARVLRRDRGLLRRSRRARQRRARAHDDVLASSAGASPKTAAAAPTTARPRRSS